MPKTTGAHGEQLAAQFLIQRLGYQVIARNWRCPTGEIDIVARDGDTLVFVEVKTRHAANTDSALVNITPAKRQRMIRAAYAYLESAATPDTPWRIDAVAVALPHRGQPIIHHVQDALTW